MHFLCLHGMGTNSRTWLSLLPCPDIGDFVSTNEEFLEYADQSSPESCIQALLALDSFIEEEGPFDAVMAFSQGAALASSLMIYRLRKDPERESTSPTFRSAVFFSGGPPEDPSDITSGSRRVMNYQANGEIIGIPTVHIWEKNPFMTVAMKFQVPEIRLRLQGRSS
ncbi:Serine hydrolase FSH [Penicillium occitanis (nom. inval.)]|nr:Serine hydrolase FSH [Penicillium occitanis (nom. inval.)]PCH10069.1 hypothetical protein PENOC_004720 [Penicillium occitanis (nom. inval.)]